MLRALVPLAMSFHASVTPSVLECADGYSKTINLPDSQEQLLILHYYGAGVSLIDRVLSHEYFYYLSHVLRRSQQIQLLNVTRVYRGKYKVFWCRCLLICPTTREDVSPLSSDLVKEVVTLSVAETGLLGSLNQIVEAPLLEFFHYIIVREFFDVISEKVVRWTLFIGLGSGLTPNSDEGVVGILAVLFSDLRLKSDVKHKMSAVGSISQYKDLTAIVSYYYLTHAIYGYFSTPLLNTLFAVSRQRSVQIAVNHLLTHEHIPDVETLLGCYLTVLALHHHFLLNQAA